VECPRRILPPANVLHFSANISIIDTGALRARDDID
jgi:hypothetical protein